MATLSHQAQAISEHKIIADFKYQEKVSQLRQHIEIGIKSGEAKTIDDISSFCDNLMQKAMKRTHSNG